SGTQGANGHAVLEHDGARVDRDEDRGVHRGLLEKAPRTRSPRTRGRVGISRLHVTAKLARVRARQHGRERLADEEGSCAGREGGRRDDGLRPHAERSCVRSASRLFASWQATTREEDPASAGQLSCSDGSTWLSYEARKGWWASTGFEPASYRL